MLKSTAFISLIAVLVPLGLATPAGVCTPASTKAGVCGSTNGTSVTVTGTQPATQSSGSPSSSWSPPGSSTPGTSGTPVDTGPSELERCRADAGRARVCLEPRRRTEPSTPAPASAPAAPTISITDLVTLTPATATPTADPSNVGIAGLPTNVVTTASVHTRTGTLFGAPLTARFTPVAYDFTYGDGTTARTTTPGAAWEHLGQPQFTPTATSHTYRDRGTYDTTVTIHYTAEIDLGTGWIPLDGTLTIPGPIQPIRIYEAHTALVAHTCTEQPTAPGC
ncbi:hypothetical protein [Microbacterium sp. NPDC090003]|uniref:hypothetical protein n=1 Tax=Microbacterium sp. NPDC090003 TaxID=3364203 RepID=UPI00382F448B